MKNYTYWQQNGQTIINEPSEAGTIQTTFKGTTTAELLEHIEYAARTIYRHQRQLAALHAVTLALDPAADLPPTTHTATADVGALSFSCLHL